MRYESSLQHWGIKGMKWGIRRYQNKDGSLTPAGRKRYSDGSSSSTSGKSKDPSSTPQAKKTSSSSSSTKKSKKEKPEPAYKKMDDAELEKTVRRLELEKRYKNAAPKENDSILPSGRDFVKRMVDNVVLPSIESAARDTLTKVLKSGFDSMIASSTSASSSQKSDKKK